MNTRSKPRLRSTLAATVAGEDIAPGDFIAALNQTIDVPSYLWDLSEASLSPHELVRLKLIPWNAGQPLKVSAVCLPFVYAKSADGHMETIDTRRIDLVRLDRECAKSVWREMRQFIHDNRRGLMPAETAHE